MHFPQQVQRTGNVLPPATMDKRLSLVFYCSHQVLNDLPVMIASLHLDLVSSIFVMFDSTQHIANGKEHTSTAGHLQVEILRCWDGVPKLLPATLNGCLETYKLMWKSLHPSARLEACTCLECLWSEM